jgi:hypothetical protein
MDHTFEAAQSRLVADAHELLERRVDSDLHLGLQLSTREVAEVVGVGK